MALLFIPSAFRRVLIVVALCFLFFPLLFSLAVNRWFAQNESAILAYLDENFQPPLKVSRIRYSLLKGILIEGVLLPEGAERTPASSLQVERIRIYPSFTLFPHPGVQLGRVIFEEPTVSLRADLSDLVQIGKFLRASSKREKRFGPFYLSTRLSSLEILKGKVSLHSSSPARPWEQAFEKVHFFLGRKLWGGERLEFGGHVAGNPKASFRIRANLKNPLPDATHMDLIFDCRKFATAYLQPHFGSHVELPDEEVTALIHLKIRKGRSFVSKGKISFQGDVARKEFLPQLASLAFSSLKYEVRGEMERGRVRLKRLFFKTAGVSLKGEGEMRISDKGSAYTVSLVSKKTSVRKFRKIFPDLQMISGEAQLFFTFAGSSQKFAPHLDLVLEDCAFYDKKQTLSWNKVDGRIRFSKDQVVVDEIWAFLNNFPLRIRGSLSRPNAPRLQLEISTYPGQVSILRPRNPINAAIRFIGEYDGKKWNGDFWMTHFLYRGQRQEEEKWKLALHGVAVEGLRPQRLLEDLFEGKEIQSQSFSLRHEGSKRTFDHLAMRRAAFLVSGEPGRLRCDLLEGPFARGSLFLQSWMEMRHFPNFSWTVNGSLSGADMPFLLHRFGKHYPVTGRLSADGTWTWQKKNTRLLGRFRLAEGMVGPTVPLQRLADETGIEPLRQIQFHEFSGHVAFRDGDLDLDNLKILSDQAELLAHVKVRGEHLTGTLSAKFPASSIRSSSDLRGLLRYVGEKERVGFDFRIAGSLGVPRIQWLSGEFKRKVEAKLAPWMRKQLSKEMERILSGRKGNDTSE